MMKILFVAPRMHTNQIEIFRVLKQEGHHVSFHSIVRGATEDYSELMPEIQNACKFSKLLSKYLDKKSTNSPRLFPNPLIYFLKFRSLSPDLVVVRDPKRLFSLLAIVCARIIGVKIVFYNQTPMRFSHTLLGKLLEESALKLFDAVLMTPIKGSYESREKNFGRKYFVPFAVRSCDNVSRVLSQPVRILTIGKYNARKNHFLLLDALQEKLQEGGVTLTIVGEVANESQVALYEQLRRHVELLGFQDSVILEKNIPYLNLQAMFEHFDLFVLPAINEPAAIVNLEALGAGMPVICSDTCGTRWYINLGVTGQVFSSGDVGSLRDAIESLIYDPNKLLEMKIAALRSSKLEFSGKAFYSSFSEMIRSHWPEFHEKIGLSVGEN